MKIRQLEFIREVARSGSFSHAAQTCNVTQPTLSNAVALLEEELGTRIFRRTTRSVELTPFGNYVLPFLEAALDACDEMKKASEAYLQPEHKILRIGLSPLADMTLLNEVLQPYRQDNPDVTIYFKECLLDDLGNRLTDGSIDIVLVPRDIVDADWDNFKLYSESLFYIPSDGETIPSSRGIRINKLPPSPIIMTGGGCGLNRSLELIFAQNAANFSPYPGAAISYTFIEQWTDLGIGAGILPESKLLSSSARALKLLDRNGENTFFEFHWAWKSGLAHIPHLASLHNHIRTRAPAIVSGRAPRT